MHTHMPALALNDPLSSAITRVKGFHDGDGWPVHHAHRCTPPSRHTEKTPKAISPTHSRIVDGSHVLISSRSRTGLTIL